MRKLLLLVAFVTLASPLYAQSVDTIKQFMGVGALTEGTWNIYGNMTPTTTDPEGNPARIFWAITPAGAMSPHASQDEAAQHLITA